MSPIMQARCRKCGTTESITWKCHVEKDKNGCIQLNEYCDVCDIIRQETAHETDDTTTD